MQPVSNLMDKMMGKKPVSEGATRPLQSNTETMRAVTWQGKKDAKVEQVPKPLLTHPDDVIVRITAFSICSGSDGHIFACEIPTMKKGFIIGHEAMGVIEEKGNNVKKLKEGDRVVIAFDIACGTCEHCLKQQYSSCETTNDSKLSEKFFGHAPGAFFGYSELMGGVPGSQAEFVRVPFGDVNCFKVPDNVPDEKALYMTDVLATSLHACELGEVSSEDTVCIWGLGPIGLCAARWCQIRRAKRVIGIDMVPERLRLAEDVLGIEVIDRKGLNSKELCDKLLRMVPKGVDVAIEAVGFRFPMSMTHKVSRALNLETDTPEIIDECLTCLKPYGRVSIVGDYAGYANMFPIGKIMFKNATVRSGQTPCQKYFDYILSKLQDGTMDPTFMITNRITMEEVPDAFMKLDKKEQGWIKVFARP